MVFSHGSEHSRGVCMFLNVNSGFSITVVHANQDGRFIIAKISIGDEQIFVVNIYAPNKYAEQELFIRNLGANLISKTNITKTVIAGDWNMSLFPKDKCGGLPWKETSYRNSIVDLMEELELVDIYRKLHSNAKAFTYESKSLKLKSRIDYFLISRTIARNVVKAEIRSSIAPDHKAIFLSLEVQGEFKRGPGTWKFNNQLLEDKDYIDLINTSYPRILDKYKEVKSKRLVWEMIKMEIRSTTIEYSKKRRLKLRRKEIEIQDEIQKLDRQICNDQYLDENILNKYESAKKELKEIYELKGKEAMFRSKARWIEQGEKPTKYFFNLEKKNYDRRIIKELKNENGEITTNFKDINGKIEDHFSKILTSKIAENENVQGLNFNRFVEGIEIPKLTYEEGHEMEHDLSMDEIKNAVKRFQKNKTPGDDGFSVEFYEAFLDLLGSDLLDCYNEAFQENKLSISQRRGIISLIPKSEENLNEITCWRPITLLNVDYKILARIIAMRIEPFLPCLIHSDQTGFIKGRYIGQNIRLLNDLMNYVDENKIPGILLFIDFEKAFDTLEWNFMNQALEKFNFGPKIRKWIKILYNDIESGVMNGGYMTNYFKVSRGVRQGCPLSPFLFVLSVEMLAIKLRHDNDCKGIKLPNSHEAKLTQFADDTTVISSNIVSLKASLRIINKFSDISGLKLNNVKTKVMWIGSQKGKKERIMDFKCTTQPIKALGAFLSYDEDKNNEENFFSKIRKMKTKLNIWQIRDLSLYGRSMLAKTVGVSQLIYAASMLTVPEVVIQKTQAELFAFLWKNKKDKIKRQVIFQSLSDGGLNFMNFRTMVKSLRLSWIGRLLDGTNASWKTIPNYFFNKYGGLSFILKCNYDTKFFERNLPLFYRELLQYFQQLSSAYGGEEKKKFILWNNKDITIDQKMLFWKSWFEQGIYFVQDLLKENGNSLSLQEFNEKFGMNVNYLHYFQIISAIPSLLKQTALQIPVSSENLLLAPDMFHLNEDNGLPISKMRCKHYYKLFNDCSVTEPTGIKNWKEKFPNIFTDWRCKFANIYQITKDNKLRQFLFKILHRVIVTKRELKKFNITGDDQCNLCSKTDSILHTFLECDETISMYSNTLKWFNDIHKLNVNPSIEQIVFNWTNEITQITSIQKRRLDLLLLVVKHYIYTCKIFFKNPNISELKSKIKLQWQIEYCSST